MEETGRRLGVEQVELAAAELTRARDERQRRVQDDLRVAERARRVRYAAATIAAPPQPLDAVTAEQAASELAEFGRQRLGAHLRDVSRPAGAGAGTGVVPYGVCTR